MNRMQMRVLSWARRVRTFVVERDVNGDLAKRTGVRHDPDETLGQLTVGATASEAITTHSRGRTTEVRRLRLPLGEPQLEDFVFRTRSKKLEIGYDDIPFVLRAFVVNDKSLLANEDALAANDDAMATLLTVLGLPFVVRGLDYDGSCGFGVLRRLRKFINPRSRNTAANAISSQIDVVTG